MNHYQNQASVQSLPQTPSAPREIPSELDRLARAASAVQDLAMDMQSRLARYMEPRPPSVDSVKAVDSGTMTDAGREIREVTVNLETTANGLRSMLSSLAI